MPHSLHTSNIDEVGIMAEITVNSFTGLRNALQDATSTVIHLGGPIIFSSGGINVPKTKGDIVIDGHGYMVTDYNSSATGDTIHTANSSGPAITVTLQNIVWNGRNYFGVVYIPEDGINSSNVTLVLDNVQYTGPQAIHNRYGITRVVDSTFSIELNGATYITNPQEFAEINRISIGGTVTIDKQTTAHSLIWFTYYNTSLTVEENAVFTVNIPNSYMFYSDVSMPVMTFNENSVTNISTLDGLYYNDAATTHIASSFTIKKGASFTATQSSRSGTVPLFKCRNSFLMEEGSFLHLFMPSSGTGALMYFSTIATVSFNNPKSVILYNNGGNVFNFAVSGTSTNRNVINIDAELINRWLTATTPLSSAGGFNDTPTRAFAKADGSNITATINATASAIINPMQTNIAAGDNGYPMDNTTFNIFQTQVLSMGNVKINLNEISDASAAITGTTEPLANLRAKYNATTLTGSAGPEGEIDLAVSPSIPVDTAVDFGVNWNFLTKWITQTSVGSVRITYLPDLPFKCFVAPSRDSIVKRKDPNWYMEITDTRTSGGDWYLYASLPEPMRSENDDTLDDVLTINEGTASEIISSAPILIRRGSWSEPGAVTQIMWPELEGFLLKIIPNYLYDPGHYTADIIWELRCTPLK